jgi:dihydrofolate reductase
MEKWRFMAEVAAMNKAIGGLRQGQAIYNVAFEQGLLDQLHLTKALIDEVDPFYDDSKIPAFLELRSVVGKQGRYSGTKSTPTLEITPNA